MSYVTIWLHCVWTTKNRESLIHSSIRPAILSHIREYAHSKSILLDHINAHQNHVHALINLGKEQNISDIMRKI